jgi:hypothetical protein
MEPPHITSLYMLWISHWQSCRSINLAQKQLRGPLPPQLLQLQFLESLDLSGTKAFEDVSGGMGSFGKAELRKGVGREAPLSALICDPDPWQGTASMVPFCR